ncbi:hypothetical protein AAC387_Pa07g1754 [Persea americana]
MACMDIFFEHCPMEPPAKIIVKDEESGETPEFPKQAPETYESFALPQDVPTLIPGEEIAYLEPGQTTKQNLQFRFRQQLTVFCSVKRYPVKLQSDIGYFIKPLSLVMDAFMGNGSYKECLNTLEETSHLLFFLHNSPTLSATF